MPLNKPEVGEIWVYKNHRSGARFIIEFVTLQKARKARPNPMFEEQASARLRNTPKIYYLIHTKGEQPIAYYIIDTNEPKTWLTKEVTIDIIKPENPEEAIKMLLGIQELI